jgi:hypothetical protein
MLAGGPRTSHARRADQWGFRAASKSPYRAMRCGLRHAREASAEQAGSVVPAVRGVRVAWAVRAVLVGQAVRVAPAEQAGLVVPAVRVAQVPWAVLVGQAVREASAEQAGLVVPAVRGAQVPSAELAGRVDQVAAAGQPSDRLAEANASPVRAERLAI